MSIILLGSSLGTFQLVNGIRKRGLSPNVCSYISSVNLTGFETSVSSFIFFEN
jgi:hypothetical protein